MLAVLAVVLPAGVVAMRSLGDGEFYQTYFTPAVMLHCDEGFVDVPLAARPPALDSFLNVESRTVDCDTVSGLPHTSVTDFHQGARWLLTGAALSWWLGGGPSWDRLLPLELFLLALSTGAVYGLLRLVARRAVAAPLAVVSMLLQTHLTMLPQLRDYSKAPFLLLGALGLSLGALAPTVRSRLIAAALAGVAAGVGLGFRSDVLILIPLGVFVLLLQPWEGHRRLWTGPAAVGAFLASFLITAAPILPSYFDRSNSGGLVAVEGLMPEFTQRLGLRSELYTVGYLYNDTYTEGLTAAYARLVQNEPGRYAEGTPQFDEAANSLYSAESGFLSADTALRAAAAMIEGFRLGAALQTPGDQPWPIPLADGLLGLLILIAALALLGARSPRALAVAIILGGGLGAVTAVQFHERHAFHLAVVAPLIVAGLVELGWRAYGRRRGDTETSGSHLPTWRQLGISTGALVLIGLVAVGIYAVLAARQDSRIDGYLRDLESSPRSPLPGQATLRDGVTVLPISRDAVARWDGMGGSHSALLRISVDGCMATNPLVTLRYAAPIPFLDFTTSMPLSRSGREDPATWYVVAVATHIPGVLWTGRDEVLRTRPAAVELSDAPGCTLRAERVFPQNLPVLLNVVRDDATRDAPRHLVPQSWIP
jgi:hypothetical protein